MKKIVSLLLIVLLVFTLTLGVAAGNISPRWVSIRFVSLMADNNGIWGDLDTIKSCNLSVTIKVYADGVLETTLKDSKKSSMGMAFDFDYDFEPGVKYTIKATYKAGSESTNKSVTHRYK